MSDSFDFKRGDRLVMDYFESDASGAAIDLTGYTITGEIRDIANALVGTLTITLSDQTQTATKGHATCVLDEAVTSTWTAGQTLRGDVKRTIGGHPFTSKTYQIRVLERVTA